MATKTKSGTKTKDYLGERIYVIDPRSPRISRIKNALNHRDGVDYGVRDTNDKVMEAGCRALEQELNLV